MSTSIPTGPTDLPDGRALNTAQPASGRSMAALYAALMQGLGFDWLRFTTMPIQIGDWKTADTALASSVASTHYMRFTPGPTAQYIWTGIQCAAGGNPGQSITVSLETDAGVVVDAGFTTRGFPRRTVSGRFLFDGSTGLFYPSDGGLWSDEAFIHSGWSVGVAGGNARRLLNVGAYQGKPLVIKLSQSNVRTYALMACEAYRSEV
jgi:hypothetical protein